MKVIVEIGYAMALLQTGYSLVLLVGERAAMEIAAVAWITGLVCFGIWSIWQGLRLVRRLLRH